MKPKARILCELFAENIYHMCTGLPKTLVFFLPSLNVIQCINYLKAKLGKHFTEPPG